jgi:hypothetical protein
LNNCLTPSLSVVMFLSSKVSALSSQNPLPYITVTSFMNGSA